MSMLEDKEQEIPESTRESEALEANEGQQSLQAEVEVSKDVDVAQSKEKQTELPQKEEEPKIQEVSAEEDLAISEESVIEGSTKDKKPQIEEVSNTKQTEDDSKSEEVLAEIDESNAEDAEDNDNHHRHHIPFLDYHEMNIENLTGELQKLVRNEKVQAIKKHADSIKHEFDLKFKEFLDGKMEDFIANGGNEIDFRYNSNTKKQFNEVYGEYREKT